MTDANIHHLRHEFLVGGLSNMFFNGVIAWLLLRGGSALSWGGEHSFVVDVLATAFILPLIVAFIVIPLQTSKLRKGKLDAMDLGDHPRLAWFADRMPVSTWARAITFGLIGMLVIAPVTLLGLALAGVESFDPTAYAVFKGAWAGLLAAILVVPMVICALRK